MKDLILRATAKCKVMERDPKKPTIQYRGMTLHPRIAITMMRVGRENARRLATVVMKTGCTDRKILEELFEDEPFWEDLADVEEI